MRKKILTALVLLALGILFVVLGSVKFEDREEVFRISDFRATVPVKRSYPVLRYVGFACLGGGAILLIVAVKKF